MLVVDVLSVRPGRLVSIQSLLRSLAAQEGCDGEPYDQMMQAADYIDQLENQLQVTEKAYQEVSLQLIRLKEVSGELLAQLDAR